jgi:hypothetical protein
MTQDDETQRRLIERIINGLVAGSYLLRMAPGRYPEVPPDIFNEGLQSVTQLSYLLGRMNTENQLLKAYVPEATPVQSDTPAERKQPLTRRLLETSAKIFGGSRCDQKK